MTASTPYYSDERVTLYHGNCLDVLRELPDSSVDSVVTDPPYGLAEHRRSTIETALRAWLNGDREHVPDGRGFMGREWDKFVPPPAVWDECFRVLKPGGHLLAFAGTRTVDLMGIAIRLAGLTTNTSPGIRDSIAWLYGSGFPKSLNVGRSIDTDLCALPVKHFWTIEALMRSQMSGHVCPFTSEGDEHRGVGTALKPAFEPIVVARKPMPSTVAANVLQYGTGTLNIDGCRVAALTSKEVARSGRSTNGGIYGDFASVDWKRSGEEHPGRWPTNVVLDQTQAAELDRQTGVSQSRIGKPRGAAAGDGWGMTATGAEYADQGGRSRFFPTFRYQPKAPVSERPKGEDGTAHPTVKPLDLMRWLVRLVTPPGGKVLDPFAGSGTAGEACLLEGFDCILMEREALYLPLIVQRISKPIRTGPDSGYPEAPS